MLSYEKRDLGLNWKISALKLAIREREREERILKEMEVSETSLLALRITVYWSGSLLTKNFNKKYWVAFY